jgi:hypothetical protein
MNFDLQRMIESKDAMRAKLAKLPFAEKVQLLEQLNERARGIRAARACLASTRTATQNLPDEKLLSVELEKTRKQLEARS